MSKIIIRDVIVFVVLFLLVFFRIFFNIDPYVISFVNVIGMIISLISTTITLTANLKKRFVAFGVFILLIELVASSVCCLSIWCKVIQLKSTANDIITVLALLFSIPIELYKKIEVVFGLSKTEK